MNNAPLNMPLYGASPKEAIVRFFKKYANFSDRASRSEYWWSYLFLVVVSVALTSPQYTSDPDNPSTISLIFALLGLIFAIGTLIPSIAVTIRRLRDAGKHPAWILISLVPLIGTIWLIVLLVQGPKGQPNVNAPSSHQV